MASSPRQWRRRRWWRQSEKRSRRRFRWWKCLIFHRWIIRFQRVAVTGFGGASSNGGSQSGGGGGGSVVRRWTMAPVKRRPLVVLVLKWIDGNLVHAGGGQVAAQPVQAVRAEHGGSARIRRSYRRCPMARTAACNGSRSREYCKRPWRLGRWKRSLTGASMASGAGADGGGDLRLRWDGGLTGDWRHDDG
jgi:hypothetical protein